MEAVGNSWGILNVILSDIYHSNQSNGFISNEWVQNLQQTWVLLVCIRWVFSTRWIVLPTSAPRKPARCYSETRSRSKDKCDKTHFSVRPRDFLHPSPINSALYVVIMLVLVCLCRCLWQIILLTYMSYELVAHFDLSLDLFLGDFWIFFNSLPPLNLNKFSEYCINNTHSLLKYM